MNPNNLPEKLNPPASPEPSPENTSSAEALPPKAEAAPPVAEPTQAPATAPAQSQAAPASSPAPPAAQPKPSTPASAADSDVIEKAWVDQAEQIIDQNQDNPYNEEEQEEDLSQQYKKKRFNIDVNDG